MNYEHLWFFVNSCQSLVNSLTLLENLKLCPKVQKITKLWIWIFVPKSNEFIVIIKHWFLLEFEFSRQKLSKIKNFQLLLILYLHKITIFGAKIQIIQVTLPFKNSQNHSFAVRKIDSHNFEFFWKLHFLHNLRFFLNSVSVSLYYYWKLWIFTPKLIFEECYNSL